MMHKVYYKVVDRYLRSAIIGNSHLRTQYELNEFVSSPYPETPLCVFDTLEDAILFKYNCCSYDARIFMCDIKYKCKLWLPRVCELNSLLRLVKAKKKFLHTVRRDLPVGTVCCKQVKLLKEIENAQNLL